MHLFALSKRRHTGKDSLSDRYGRLWELTSHLADRGHAVTGIAAAYRGERAIVAGSWRSVPALPHPMSLRLAWQRALPATRPDLIWASSDAPHLVAASHLARQWRVPVVLDHYDDYEAFGLTRWLGLTQALRRASAGATALTVVGHRLAASLVERGVTRDMITVVPNGVPSGFVSDVSREEARERLGLPQGVALFGTAGALDESRGIADLGTAANMLSGRARLVIAGPGDRRALGHLPADAVDLGQLSQSQVPLLYRALDVGVVCNRDSAFGRHCHPMKLVEMIACGLPLVASDVGEVAELLLNNPESRYPAGNPSCLAERLENQLAARRLLAPCLALKWSDLGDLLERALIAAKDAGI